MEKTIWYITTLPSLQPTTTLFCLAVRGRGPIELHQTCLGPPCATAKLQAFRRLALGSRNTQRALCYYWLRILRCPGSPRSGSKLSARPSSACKSEAQYDVANPVALRMSRIWQKARWPLLGHPRAPVRIELRAARRSVAKKRWEKRHPPQTGECSLTKHAQDPPQHTAPKWHFKCTAVPECEGAPKNTCDTLTGGPASTVGGGGPSASSLAPL